MGFGTPGGEGADDAVNAVMAHDMLIDAMQTASEQSEDALESLVRDSILSLDKDFWMRVALRADSCEAEEDKQQMSVLASKVMLVAEKVIHEAEEQVEDAGELLMEVLKEAANDKGEWHLPLTLGESGKMRAAIKRLLFTGSAPAEKSSQGESLLATTFAWIRRAQGDGDKGGITPLLQKVLEIYAGEALSRSAAELEASLGDKAQEAAEARRLVAGIFASDETQWDEALAGAAGGGQVTIDQVLNQVQISKEMVVLGMGAGMHEQKIMVEYLQELEDRANRAFGVEVPTT